MCFEGNQAAAAAAAAPQPQLILMMMRRCGSKFKFWVSATISQPFFGSKVSFALLPPAFFKNISRSTAEALDPLTIQKHTDIQFVPHRQSRSSTSPCQRVCLLQQQRGGTAKGEHFTPNGVSKAPAQTKCSVRSCRVCFLQLRTVPSA